MTWMETSFSRYHIIMKSWLGPNEKDFLQNLSETKGSPNFVWYQTKKSMVSVTFS